MSKYTVQLRWLVEQYLENYNIKNPILNPPLLAQHNWRFIYGDLGLSNGTDPNTGFQLSAYPIFDEDHRHVLNDMLIKRYWNCEIGAETPAMFAWNLNEAMCRIMPYYNGLYRAQMASIVDMITEKWGETDIEGIVRKVLNEVNGKTDTTSNTEGGYNVDTTGKSTVDTDTTDKTVVDTDTKDNANGSVNTMVSGNIQNNGSTNVTGTRDLTVDATVTTESTDRFLDTPQASVSNLDDGWLTNVRKVNGTESTDRTENEKTVSDETREDTRIETTTTETTTTDTRTGEVDTTTTGTGTVDTVTDTTGNETGTSSSKNTGNVTTENSATTDDTTNRDRKADGWRISPKDWEGVLTAAKELFNIDRMVVEDKAVQECFMMVW